MDLLVNFSTNVSVENQELMKLLNLLASGYQDPKADCAYSFPKILRVPVSL